MITMEIIASVVSMHGDGDDDDGGAASAATVG
jgi:hypothetical protein